MFYIGGILMLEINFLSKNKLILDGNSIDKKVGNKGIVLLGLLMISERKSLSKEKVIDILWPDSAEEAARYNLRYNIWKLRKALNAKKYKNIIMTYGGNCYINPKYEYTCDIEKIMASKPAEYEDRDKLKGLLELFDCDFLDLKYYPECSDLNEKIIMQRYMLDNKKLEICKRYIELSYREKEYSDCMWALELCDGMDPYDEENVQKRLSILISQKEYGRAIKYYQLFHGRLVHDLGVEPSDETKKMLEKVKKNVPPQKDVIHKMMRFEVRAIAGVKFYWIADMIRNILSKKYKELIPSIPKEARETLAYLQYRCGGTRGEVSDARLIDAVLAFVVLACNSGDSIGITIGNPEALNQVDKDIINLMTLKTNGRMQFSF